MVAYLLYTKDSPAERAVRRLAEELERAHIDLELVEADGPHGIALTDIYDLLSRPAVVLVRDDGTLVQTWQEELPAVTDVSYLVNQ